MRGGYLLLSSFLLFVFPLCCPSPSGSHSALRINLLAALESTSMPPVENTKKCLSSRKPERLHHHYNTPIIAIQWTPSNLDPWNEACPKVCFLVQFTLKWSHPSNQDTLTGPWLEGVHYYLSYFYILDFSSPLTLLARFMTFCTLSWKSTKQFLLPAVIRSTEYTAYQLLFDEMRLGINAFSSQVHCKERKSSIHMVQWRYLPSGYSGTSE